VNGSVGGAEEEEGAGRVVGRHRGQLLGLPVLGQAVPHPDTTWPDYMSAVFRIRLSLNGDPDPGFYLNANPDFGFRILIQGLFSPNIKINGKF